MHHEAVKISVIPPTLSNGHTSPGSADREMALAMLDVITHLMGPGDIPATARDQLAILLAQIARTLAK